jgi:hypothetical protein
MQVYNSKPSLNNLQPSDIRHEMKTNLISVNCLIAALSLGTAWAVRGKFGHEQGAAWAGAVGALAILLLAKRSDWYSKVFNISLATAFGWGVGGIISYGRVVGFGRGTDFVNVYYGLLMLFVIGGLYGFIGGGFFGLALSDSDKYKVKWHSLIIEMTVWALITYGLLINQLEWLMTPPRSELWAACLGMAIALGWYMVRNKQESALRVAIFACLGSGFGFAFGNFLQVLGSVSGIKFNFWNVMEYSIGFFGGLGMAYGTFTSHWPVSEATHKKSENLIPILILMLFIPFVVWQQSFDLEKLQEIFNAIAEENTSIPVLFIQLTAIVSIILTAVFIFYTYYLQAKDDFVHLVIRLFGKFLYGTLVCIFS